MLSAIRPLARPLSAVALLLFMAPGAVVQCGEISAVAGEVMACCKATTGAGLKADCCAVDDTKPASERPWSTTVLERSSSHALAPVDALPPLGAPAPSRDGTITGSAGHAPPDRLYIRYAAIRR